MGFRAELQAWTERQVQRNVLASEIRKLLLGDETGILYPILRRYFPRELLEYRLPDREPDQVVIPGTWIYYPVSDDAPYSWGDPYSTELGTPLAGIQCAVGQLRTIEKAKRPYRLYDGDADQVTHGTDLMAGRFYWKHDDYVISWGPCMGHESTSEQFTDNTTRSVYRNGVELASTDQISFNNPYEIRGAAIRHIGGTNYLYIISNGTGTGAYTTANLIQRAVIDPYGQNQTPTWQSSPGITNALSGLTPPFHTTSFDGGTTYLLPCSFNKSCTRVLICQPGRVVELDITNWGSETVVSDTYFGDSYVLPPDTKSPGEGTIPVLSAYQVDSDIRRDLKVRVNNTGDPTYDPGELITTYYATVTATLLEDDTEITSYTLYDLNQSNGWRYREAAFITVNPYFQDLQGQIYCVDYHRAWRAEDDKTIDNPEKPWMKRYHNFEVYKGTEKVKSTETIENFPAPDPWNTDTYDRFTRSGAATNRDAQIYPQYGVLSENHTWLWFVNEEVLTWILGECVGHIIAKPSSGNHWIDDNAMQLVSNQVTYDSTSYNYDNLNHFAFAANWEGSYVISRRIFNDWDPNWPSPDAPTYRWWNVGTVDLLAKTGTTGDDQRLLTRGCKSEPAYLKNDWNHIAPYHVSADQPFPP